MKHGMFVGAAAFLFASCGAEGAGCYVFDWGPFEALQRVPTGIVPDGVVLTSRRTDAEWRRAEPRVASTGQRHLGHVQGWDAILYDRRWSKSGDTLTIELKDLGYNNWVFALAEHDGQWLGEARYTTTIGGGERTYIGTVGAKRCPEGP